MVSKIQQTRRKSPVQARSVATVQTIHEATIQVLISHGLPYLTTARVAERAGVSVGSIYQYYPNKQALLMAVLTLHLENIVHAMETVCDELRGKSLDAMGMAITSAYVAVKMQRPEVSRALYALPSDEVTNAIVARATERGQLAICNLLQSCADARFNEPRRVASVFTGALVGPVQMMLTGAILMEHLDEFTEHLLHLSIGYLRQASVSK
jgi:AcrR family transcriptional regulator